MENAYKRLAMKLMNHCIRQPDKNRFDTGPLLGSRFLRISAVNHIIKRTYRYIGDYGAFMGCGLGESLLAIEAESLFPGPEKPDVILASLEAVEDRKGNGDDFNCRIRSDFLASLEAVEDRFGNSDDFNCRIRFDFGYRALLKEYAGLIFFDVLDRDTSALRAMIKELLSVARDRGVIEFDATCVVDMERGASALLKEMGINLRALYTFEKLKIEAYK